MPRSYVNYRHNCRLLKITPMGYFVWLRYLDGRD